MDKLANFISEYPPEDENGQPMEAMLTKFVLLTEWMDGDGNKYLLKRTANGAGELIPHWDAKGLLFEGLYGDFEI